MRLAVAALAAVLLVVPVGGSHAAAPPAPLIGAAFSRWGVAGCDTYGMGILATYNQAGIRRRVRLQLAAMHAAGLSSLRLMIWHSVHDDPFGMVSSQSGRLDEPYRTNLVRYLTDVREAGFDSLTVDFAPQGPNDPIGTPENLYEPSLFEQNWSFIKDVRPLVKTYGPTLTRIDLLSEGAPSDYWPYKGQMMAYVTEMYRRYADAFGTDDVVVSAIAPPDPYADITQPEGGHRLQNLIDALRASGRDLPAAFSVHVSTWWGPSAAHTLYALRQEDATLTANGLSQPLIVGETIYNDPELAGAIAEFRRTSSRPILEVQEWPLERGSSCRDFSVAPPFIADAYIEALIGGPRLKTLTGGLTPAGKVSLVAPYGSPATALVAGAYSVVFEDESPMKGLRLVGPGVRLKTGSRFTGSVTWPLELRRGVYWYGSGRKLRHRLAVL
ncbi:MAG TPA: hypothetical protein VFU26_15150 [Gaiellaceae bacterium]|nr:hypothetical protein [Gaiellaceae bacterium]